MAKKKTASKTSGSTMKKSAPAKKPAPKKPAPKKPAAKKPAPKKPAPKKPAAKKPAAKKPAPKKPAPKKPAPKKPAPVAKALTEKRVVPPAKKSAPIAKMPASTTKLPPELEALRQKAIAGDGKAACALGDAFYRGRGVTEDFLAARGWYVRAAELGNVDAMGNLVMFYSKGDVARWTKTVTPSVATPPDLAEALRWARASTAAGKDRSTSVTFLEKAIATAGASVKKPSGPMSVEQQRKAILANVDEAKLGHLRAKVAASFIDSIRLQLSKATTTTRASRFGGAPDLPTSTPWPVGPKNPLSFMAQIDLAQIATLDEDGLLPKSGLLSFFWDAVGNARGLGHEQGTSFRVIYTPADTRLEERAPPSTLKAPHKYTKVVFEPLAVRGVRETTIPFVRTAEVRSWGATEKEIDVYWDEVYGGCDDIWPAGESPYHRMLGHADATQGDMTRRMSYLLADKYEQLDKKPIPELEEDAKSWRLLLQIDTDEALQTNWGEGRLFFWIRAEDLAELRFDRAWFQFQQ